MGERPAPDDPRAPEEASEEEFPADLMRVRRLHPLPRGLVELYGILAVLFVLVPEWMAGSALFGFRDARQGSDLPVTTQAWQRVPELRLASLNLAGLRLLARQEGLRGYASLGRDRLSQRLLRRLARRGQPPRPL